VIDLHCHILPGLDDGPANMDFSLAMARRAVESNIQIMVATPHIRADYDGITAARIAAATDELNGRIEDDGLPLRVIPGAEVAIPKLEELSDDELTLLSLGSGGYVLLESPYGAGPVDVEAAVRDIGARGHSTILAHPERCPLFHADIERLATLAERGVLCSITSASLAGAFGDRARSFSVEMLRRGLVHDVASDAHDHLHRPPFLRSPIERLDAELPGIARSAAWFTVTAPVAILAGNEIPPAPRFEAAQPTGLKRLFRRREHS
jgi:protein-tyrosine phosphatase